MFTDVVNVSSGMQSDYSLLMYDSWNKKLQANAEISLFVLYCANYSNSFV